MRAGPAPEARNAIARADSPNENRVGRIGSDHHRFGNFRTCPFLVISGLVRTGLVALRCW